MRNSRRLKRTFNSTHWRQTLVLSGVFLVGVGLFPTKASALTPAFHQPEIKATLSPLQQNEKQIDDLKANFEFKKSLIEKKQTELAVVEDKTKEVIDTKESLKAQVDDIQAQVADLKAKVAEKKRLEALRIVTIGSYADDAAGNMYADGNCTWYVKSRRPDIPNNLGNANTWYYNAQAQGFQTGSMAKTGAIGTTTRGALGHVVYVEKWLGDGQILISEMNYSGLYSQRTRVADESEFVYIYAKP